MLSINSILSFFSSEFKLGQPKANVRQERSLTSGVHTRVAQIKVIRLVLGVPVQLPHELQEPVLSQTVLQILPYRQREQVRPVQYQRDVGPTELLEHAGEDEPQSALAVRHPR